MIVCSRCGYENQLGHIFCTHCRTRLDFDHVSDQELVRTKKVGGRKWLRIMLIVALLVVVAIGLALWPLPIEAKRGTSADLQQARRKMALMERSDAFPSQVFTESELNACLAAAMEIKRKSGAFRMRSVQVDVKPNAILLSVAATWEPIAAGGVRIGTLDVTYGITGVPEITPAGFHFAVSRGMIGHLPSPGPLGIMIAPQIKAHFKGLRQDYPVVGAIKRFELEDGKIIVFSR